jgi:hypothetical protein
MLVASWLANSQGLLLFDACYLSPSTPWMWEDFTDNALQSRKNSNSNPLHRRRDLLTECEVGQFET